MVHQYYGADNYSYTIGSQVEIQYFMILFLIIIISAYDLALLLLIVGWHKIRRVSVRLDCSFECTVLIPFRNEEDNLESLVKALSTLNYPVEKFEVIFINDHSEDDSHEVLSKLLEDVTFKSKIISISHLSGKKAALASGIKHAGGDIIVTTDADCIMHPDWLATYATYYKETDAHFVFGPVSLFPETSFFEQLQSMEFSSLIGTGAAGMGIGIPSMCNGANLSFRREDFFKVGGYSGNKDLASGDDEFLMHKIYKAFEGKVFFNKKVEAIIHTRPMATWKDFFNQRKRWAGKWKYYSNWRSVFMAIFVFLVNLSVLVGAGMLISNFGAFRGVLMPLVIKLLLEAVFLFIVMTFLHKKFGLLHFLILQLSYPFYALFFGIAVNFGSYTWKGRRH